MEKTIIQVESNKEELKDAVYEMMLHLGQSVYHIIREHNLVLNFVKHDVVVEIRKPNMEDILHE